MKLTLLIATMLVFSLSNAAGQAKVLTNDPLTGLPLIPATVVVKNAGNEPEKLPDAQVCKSKMQGDFYSLYNYFSQNKIKINEATVWYAAHLSGFKKVQGYESGRSQIAFFNSDRTIVIFLTGNKGAPGEDTEAYSVSYQRYQPGISEETIAGLTRGNIVCR